MLNSIEISSRIKSKMKELNLRQKDICDQTGIAKSAMSNYMNGNRIPDTETILKICKSLNTSIEWILTGKKMSSNANLSEEELNLIQAYREVSPEVKKIVINTLEISRPNMDEISCTRTG